MRLKVAFASVEVKNEWSFTFKPPMLSWFNIKYVLYFCHSS